MRRHAGVADGLSVAGFSAMFSAMRFATVAAVLLVAAPALAHPPAGVVATESALPPPSAVPKRIPLPGDRDLPLDEIKAEIAREKLDGWLLTDFRGQDDVALALVRPRGEPSRRWFFFIPKAGDPVALTFRTEAAALADAPGRKLQWDSWRDLDGKLRALLKGSHRIAVAWSPKGALPSVSRVDGGLIERLRAAGAEVVSSGDLVTFTSARWSEAQRASHYFAMSQLSALKAEAWQRVLSATAAGGRLRERDLAQFLAVGLGVRGLETDVAPVVAVDVHTADPDYLSIDSDPLPQAGPEAGRKGEGEIRRGSLVRIELAARQAGVPDAVYAEGIWTGFVGDAAPERLRAAWSAVRDARDRAVALLRERIQKKSPVRGFEVDDAARAVLVEKFRPNILHATGHSIDALLAGDGPDLDDLESHDDRRLLARTGYLIAPGLYFPGEFGVRSGVDVYLTDGTVEITGGQPQQDLEMIHAAPTPPTPATPAIAKPVAPPPIGAPLATGKPAALPPVKPAAPATAIRAKSPRPAKP